MLLLVRQLRPHRRHGGGSRLADGAVSSPGGNRAVSHLTSYQVHCRGLAIGAAVEAAAVADRVGAMTLRAAFFLLEERAEHSAASRCAAPDHLDGTSLNSAALMPRWCGAVSGGSASYGSFRRGRLCDSTVQSRVFPAVQSVRRAVS